MNMIEGEMLRRAQLRRDATQSIEAAVEYFTERHPEMSTQEVWGLAAAQSQGCEHEVGHYALPGFPQVG